MPISWHPQISSIFYCCLLSFSPSALSTTFYLFSPVICCNLYLIFCLFICLFVYFSCKFSIWLSFLPLVAILPSRTSFQFILTSTIIFWFLFLLTFTSDDTFNLGFLIPLPLLPSFHVSPCLTPPSFIPLLPLSLRPFGIILYFFLYLLYSSYLFTLTFNLVSGLWTWLVLCFLAEYPMYRTTSRLAPGSLLAVWRSCTLTASRWTWLDLLLTMERFPVSSDDTFITFWIFIKIFVFIKWNDKSLIIVRHWSISLRIGSYKPFVKCVHYSNSSIRLLVKHDVTWKDVILSGEIQKKT